MQFSIQHLSPADFKSDGLRPFFEYRDLGIKSTTQGKVLAHVVKARPAMHEGAGWHRHILHFQMVYVLKGWARFEYEGHGEHTLTAGTCVQQPPGIRHREIDHSDDLELIEITIPADFETIEG